MLNLKENQLETIKRLLEQYFKDAVDFEFVVNRGKIWITNARVSKRSNVANLKICIDLFREKIIEEKEVVKRIKPQDIIETLTPQIRNLNALQKIGKGLSASHGVATGRIFFCSDNLSASNEKDSILCRIEVSPEDLDAMRASKAIVTIRGGMTSHAAVISRGFGKPCICGLNDLKIDYRRRIGYSKFGMVKEGDWVTVDAINGNFLLGKGDFSAIDWRDNEHLVSLLEILSRLILTDAAVLDSVGKIWFYSDFFLHNTSLKEEPTSKKAVPPKYYKSFSQPDAEALAKIYSSLENIEDEKENLNYIIKGIRRTLIRLLSNKHGIGKHYKYYKPVIDPMLCIKNYSNNKNEYMYRQLIGEEFFNISKTLPNLIDIFSVRIFFEIGTNSKNGLSFLDFTNPLGESVVLNESCIVGFYLEINNQAVSKNDLPVFYNAFRKREYFWEFYSENLTSQEELSDFLRKAKDQRQKCFRLSCCAHELGLMVNDELSQSGQELIS